MRDDWDTVTAAELRRRGSLKWTVCGPDGYGAGVAEQDFGAAPEILAALHDLGTDARFGYLPPDLATELGGACADFQQHRHGWSIDPDRVHDVPDVLNVLEIAITAYSRPGSPVILPTPAYMPFLHLPGFTGRGIIQVPMARDGDRFVFDLDGIDAAFRAGGHLLVLCNPYNPLGRVFTVAEITALTAIVDRHGGRVFADEIHAPLVYPGARHLPYASTSATAAGHAITAVSASKAWNLPGLKCAQAILTNPADEQRWQQLPVFAPRGASNAGVVANIAAYRHGDAWLADVLDYLDDGRRLFAAVLAEQLPGARHRMPEGTYLAWVDATALDLPDSPGALLAGRAAITVVDGPEFGAGGAGSFRVNLATGHTVLREMAARMATALTG